ncbi:MAG TPA: hypothetical protein VFA68_04885 [Terriglobales bacterium]|nr:hypothetical protein [Terriglobales bacterium]
MMSHEIAVEIGEMPVLLRTEDSGFRDLLARRYAGFLSSAIPKFEFDVDLVAPTTEMESDLDVEVRMQHGVWHLHRGDFRAQWDPGAGRGTIRQTANPYSIDSVLRILHTLLLAKSGGFLLHAASAIRNGQAFLFSGVSGAGKTTISRLAPNDAILLTDEISYVRRTPDRFYACGTPFAGELARSGQNCSAPIRTLFFLQKGPKHSTESIGQAEAIRNLMRNILFFAEDQELVKSVFRSACEFVESVPVRRLTFLPNEQVWDLVV